MASLFLVCDLSRPAVPWHHGAALRGTMGTALVSFWAFLDLCGTRAACRWPGPMWLLLATSLALGGCSRGQATGEGLLAGALPESQEGVAVPARMTDGIVPPEGSSWNSNRTSIFRDRSSFVQYDLGKEEKIAAAALLADNNDDYVVTVSSDGVEFRRLWLAKRSRASGLRWRTTQDLDGSARFVRITPGKGDRALSVAEFALYRQKPATLPPQLLVKAPLDSGLHYRNALLTLATALLIACGLASRRRPLVHNLALCAVALFGVSQAGLALYESFPLGPLEVSMTRAIAAAIALGVVAKEAFSRPRDSGWPILNVSVLTLAATLGVGSFFNMGHPQFFDQKHDEPSVVHNFDMRVYFPVAKYFDELRYDGLYLASVLSYAEEHGGLDRAHIQKTELRDLRDHRMRRVSDIQSEVEAIRSRFSEKRWAQFKKDMSYFWETMGSHQYLGSMRDHGGNATPVWLSIAYLMFRDVPASNEILLWTGLLDPLLLLLFAGVVWRTFGVRTALVSLVIFGANDFYMFGSNWAGATLRNDWMVYLGLGVCALKSERYKLGGALLALSALIRAFPAIALLALGVPVAYALLQSYRAEGKLPTPRRVFEEQRWFFEAALGATACVLVAVVASSLVMGLESWPLWVKKISSFTASPHVNHVSLLTVTSGSEGNQAAVRSARVLFHVAATALYVILALWAAYKRPAHQVALLGISLMPVFMYPANYYIHFIFLLPLVVAEPLEQPTRFLREQSGKVWGVLLMLCAAQYFTVKESDLANHFYNASVLLMAALLAMLIFLLPRDDEGYVRSPLPPA